MNRTRNRPRIVSPCVADRYTDGPKRIAEVFDPETELGCLIVVSRMDDSLHVTISRPDDGVVIGAQMVSDLAVALMQLLPPDAKDAKPDSVYGRAYAALKRAGFVKPEGGAA